MAASKVMHGARAKVVLADPNSETPILIGIFHTISWGLQLDVAPVNILGLRSYAVRLKKVLKE